MSRTHKDAPRRVKAARHGAVPTDHARCWSAPEREQALTGVFYAHEVAERRRFEDALDEHGFTVSTREVTGHLGRTAPVPWHARSIMPTTRPYWHPYVDELDPVMDLVEERRVLFSRREPDVRWVVEPPAAQEAFAKHVRQRGDDPSWWEDGLLLPSAGKANVFHVITGTRTVRPFRSVGSHGLDHVHDAFEDAPDAWPEKPGPDTRRRSAARVRDRLVVIAKESRDGSRSSIEDAPDRL